MHFFIMAHYINTTPETIQKHIDEFDYEAICEWTEMIKAVNAANYMDSFQSKRLFAAYNFIFDMREYGYHCSTCRSRVIKRLNSILPQLQKRQEHGT
jgi:hypothetical protein